MREFYIAEIGTWGNHDCKRVGLFTWGGGGYNKVLLYAENRFFYVLQCKPLKPYYK